ncbi:TIGR04283 family arsenosugar biosynthesis glycosyltransferase [Winogradskyella ursingii]|uniref:TIGR04283 family arsenosugar biosynthesis glycosyltransferase n=1 Tax=Winogradskyella ursingii TaxID=2686079 RepID=UPI0015CA2181|nr:TIGR04283 family arsenosugar biosynthesis glycosyltransferase [Winogradskyella ursingii]
MISIIIPVLNEAESIGDLLNHLVEKSDSKNISEIIIVDGGSMDETAEIVKSISTALDGTVVQLINSEKGRAKQLNNGANVATGNILYFLHADSFPPKDFDRLIINEVEKGNKAGCFRMQFDSNHWWLRLASWLTQFSWRACRGGDQSQFITRELFDEIGGYDENYIIYEDNILINELFARKQFVVINHKLKTSARMYKKHGVWKVQYHFWTIYVKKWFGASADEMLAYYKRHLC